MELKQREKLMQTMHRFKKTGLWPPSMAGVSSGEFYMLHKISHMIQKSGSDIPGVKISNISDEMNMSRPAASQMLNSLEDKELIDRVIAKNDRRVWYITLTEQGRKVLKTAFVEINTLMDSVVARLGEQDTAELIRLFQKLNDIIEEIRKEKSE